MQSVRLFVKILGHGTRSEQLAVDAVNPAVIRALEFRYRSAVLQTNKGTAMSTDVSKCLYLAIGATYYYGGLFVDSADQEIALFRYLRDVAGHEPIWKHDMLEFPLIDGWIGIKALLERPSGAMVVDEIVDRTGVLHGR